MADGYVLRGVSRRILVTLSMVLASLLLGGAGVFLMLHPQKGIGIFLVLFAAIAARVLVLNIPEILERRTEGENDRDEA